MHSNSLLDHLESEGKALLAKLGTANVYDHNLSRGECREAIIKFALRPILPRYFGLAPGQVFGADGAVSKALDIIMYDSVFSVVLPTLDGRIVAPADSVFGSIEIKTKLNSEELDDVIEKTRSLVSIERPHTNAYQFTPYAGLDLGATLTGDTRDRSHYVNAAIALGGMDGRTVRDVLAKEMDEDRRLPDIVVNLSKGFTVVKVTRIPEIGLTLGDTEWAYRDFTYLDTGHRTIPLFCLYLIEKCGMIRLKSSQPHGLYNSVLRSLRPEPSDPKRLA